MGSEDDQQVAAFFSGGIREAPPGRYGAHDSPEYLSCTFREVRHGGIRPECHASEHLCLFTTAARVGPGCELPGSVSRSIPHFLIPGSVRENLRDLPLQFITTRYA